MKSKKRDEVDVSTLPEFQALVVSLNQLCKESNARRNREAIMKTKRTDFSFLGREEIKTFGKEKGLWAPVDEKKKDKAVEGVPRECTPAVLAEAFGMLIEENVIGKRMEKKEIADLIAAGKPIPVKKKDEKKTGKDGKKKKDEEEVEEVEVQFPKDYEHVYVVENYPETQEEFEALGKTKGGVGK